jgi:phosphoribosylformylglycinamidine synthase
MGLSRLGALVSVAPGRLRPDALLFGESAGRVLVSCGRHQLEQIEHLALRQKVPMEVIGKVGGARLSIAPWIDLLVDDADQAWSNGLAQWMNR